MPAEDPLHESVALPDPPGILVGFRVQARLVEFIVAARLTVPVNPLTGATVIVESPTTPAFRAVLVGLAVIVKSGTTLTL